MATFFVSACGPSRLTLEGNRLKKNVITADSRKVETGSLSGYLQQTPNKRFLGLNLYTWIYKQSYKGKERKYKKWFRDKFGQQPVMVDQGRVDASARDMKLYLNNLGYFESNVDTRIEVIKNKKARVHYSVLAGQPYVFRDISSTIDDDTIARMIEHRKQETLLKSGDNFNAYSLDEERTRITEMLKNNGYYAFSKDFIRYEIDSSLNSHQMDVVMHVDNNRRIASGTVDSIIEFPHIRYRINQVFIEPHFDPLDTDGSKMDTLLYHQLRRKTADTMETYTFLYRDKLKIRPGAIAQSVFFNTDEFYKQRDVTQTNSQLSRMPFNRLVNIYFSETTPESDGDSLSQQGLLDTFIQITNAPVNSFSIETDVTNRAGNPGMAGSLMVQNKNLFHGAEVFRIRLHGAIELQRSAEKEQAKFLFFNTIEAGVIGSLHIPRFLVPFNQARFSKYFRPQTSFSLSYTYQLQPDYIRHMSNGSFGYNWEPNREKHHDLYPVEVTSIGILPDDSSDFYKYVNETNDPWLKEQYSDHFILSSRYNYIYSSQQFNKSIDFIYLNYQVETGGNLIKLFSNLTDAPIDSLGRASIFNLPYAQYVRQEFDFRYYHYILSRNTLVLRGYIGLGIPYGNSSVMPYERAFPAGGSNDLRGWIFRRVGPGSFATDTIDFDRAGDIKLLGNIEYRFPIYKILKGAVFTDFGNIWLLNESEQFPGGEFRFNRFYEEIAVDAGIGLRLDFGFFIIRLDWASQIRDPFMSPGDRWITSPAMKSNVVWNLGIGYPF